MINPVGSADLKPLFIYDPDKHHQLIKEAEGLPSVVVSSATAGNAVMLGGGYFTPLEGFMNLREQAPGLNGITVKTHVKSDASPEKLQELHDYVNEHSPIFDTIANPVKISSELVNS